MSKIETTSKVSLKLTSSIDPERQGAHTKLSILDIVHKPPTSRKGLSQAEKGPIFPTGTTKHGGLMKMQSTKTPLKPTSKEIYILT